MSSDEATVALMNVFIEGLEEARIKRGWSQADLARAMGVTEGYVSVVLNGNRNLTLRFLAHALAAMNARIDEIV